uniref:DNA-directed RNA polymerase subunit alpha n=1 Tax=Schizocladia ischiensis TaxID=196139 RepID=A0A7S6UA03_9STRA|nr:RNA polymerase alpha subunit [Schizocladia ischiensis]QOW07555.1 RNA polymerase alpha subunit [Schizocladia ischiensis]
MLDLQFECVELNIETPTEYFGRFVFKPLDFGEGITIGNMLRRVLLNGLPGLSIIGVRIAGVNHEFSAIPGVREDILELILNLKQVIFKTESRETCFGRLKVQGPAIVTASSLQLPQYFEIVNPYSYLATISDNSILELEIKIDWGKGYTLAKDQKIEGPVDFLAIDSIFMPITKTNYFVEPFSSEIIVTKEQLILDIWTNGSITPQEALSQAANILIQWLEPIKNIDTNLKESKKKIETQKESQQKIEIQTEETKDILLENLKLSSRSYNALKRENINSLNDLQNYSLTKLKKIKNFGKKSFQEVQNLLKNQYGIILK